MQWRLAIRQADSRFDQEELAWGLAHGFEMAEGQKETGSFFKKLIKTFTKQRNNANPMTFLLSDGLFFTAF